MTPLTMFIRETGSTKQENLGLQGGPLVFRVTCQGGAHNKAAKTCANLHEVVHFHEPLSLKEAENKKL
jgi:hypothetical protein